jgi:hypothetical protein
MPRARIKIAQLMAIVLLLGVAFCVVRVISRKNAEIADLALRLKIAQNEVTRKYSALFHNGTVGELELSRSVYETPAGNVLAVNLKGREVVIDMSKAVGAKSGMRLAVFDSAALTLQGPYKAIVELVEVGEGFSTARVIKSGPATGPVAACDLVYSPAWSARGPMRFALIGKIDRDRDDKDDRDELKAIIQQSGGVIDFDLPPPDVGSESGAIWSRIDWYVLDGRYDHWPHDAQAIQFAKRVGEAIKNARLNGIRPLPFHKLLALLGYL